MREIKEVSKRFFLLMSSNMMLAPLGSCFLVGGVVASWLVRSSPDRAVLVRALAGGIVSCMFLRTLNSHQQIVGET